MVTLSIAVRTTPSAVHHIPDVQMSTLWCGTVSHLRTLANDAVDELLDKFVAKYINAVKGLQPERPEIKISVHCSANLHVMTLPLSFIRFLSEYGCTLNLDYNLIEP